MRPGLRASSTLMVPLTVVTSVSPLPPLKVMSPLTVLTVIDLADFALKRMSPLTLPARRSPPTSPLASPLTDCSFRSPNKPLTLKSALTNVAARSFSRHPHDEARRAVRAPEAVLAGDHLHGDMAGIAADRDTVDIAARSSGDLDLGLVPTLQFDRPRHVVDLDAAVRIGGKPLRDVLSAWASERRQDERAQRAGLHESGPHDQVLTDGWVASTTRS
jgi:hypothetical protein